MSQAQSKAQETVNPQQQPSEANVPIVQVTKQGEGFWGSSKCQGPGSGGQDSNPRLSGFIAWAFFTLPW